MLLGPTSFSFVVVVCGLVVGSCLNVPITYIFFGVGFYLYLYPRLLLWLVHAACWMSFLPAIITYILLPVQATTSVIWYGRGRGVVTAQDIMATFSERA